MTRGFVNPLARGTPGVIASARAIKEWTRELLQLSDAAVVSVNEIACTLPGCPPKETVILIMLNGRIRQGSVHKAIGEVAEADIKPAFSAPATNAPFAAQSAKRK